MTVTLLQGDCLSVLQTLDACSVQTCVTSPPYFGLRDYQTAKWEGGDSGCDHLQEVRSTRGGPKSTITGGQDLSAHVMNYRHTCGKCGAIRIDDQIGLEETPEAYVSKLVEVFREVRRVLKDTGTLWLNLGDSYFSDTKGTGGTKKIALNGGSPWVEKAQQFSARKFPKVDGIKPKDLIGIPWLVAFALRADGWYLRSEIIWHKPNPMPESVRDRPTKAHEQIFLLSKSPQYFYDADAVREPNQINPNSGWAKEIGADRNPLRYNPKKSIRKDGGSNTTLRDPQLLLSGRNRRTVWTVTTKPYKEAHFATFPPDLIEPCILAGSRPGDTVLDPFNGSGTTGAVSVKHGRNYLGIELNPSYIELSQRRIEGVQMVAP